MHAQALHRRRHPGPHGLRRVDVCEQASFLGHLDQRADPFYTGAMPDDLHKPSGMPPAIRAVAVCIASNTERWGLPAIRSDHALAARGRPLLHRVHHPADHRVNENPGRNEDGAEGTSTASTSALNYALANIRLCLCARWMIGAAPLRCHADAKRPDSVDARKINNALKCQPEPPRVGYPASVRLRRPLWVAPGALRSGLRCDVYTRLRLCAAPPWTP